MPLYAAYGSDLDPAQLHERCPHSPIAGQGWLTGWRLTFGGQELGFEGAVATVVQDPASSVFVQLYDVTETDADALRLTQGPAYRSLTVRVATLERDEVAWLFVLDGYEGGLPSARYLGSLADAADRAGAPSEYVADLRLRPCRSDHGR